MSKEEEQEDLFDTIDYSVDGNIDHVVFLEDIAREFGLEVESYWLREARDTDWMATNGYVVSKTKPFLPEEYDHVYSLCYTNDNKNITLFADSLIDGLVQVWGYLEACLKIEIDTKKGDTS